MMMEGVEVGENIWSYIYIYIYVYQAVKDKKNMADAFPLLYSGKLHSQAPTRTSRKRYLSENDGGRVKDNTAAVPS